MLWVIHNVKSTINTSEPTADYDLALLSALLFIAKKSFIHTLNLAEPTGVRRKGKLGVRKSACKEKTRQ